VYAGVFYSYLNDIMLRRMFADNGFILFQFIFKKNRELQL